MLSGGKRQGIKLRLIRKEWFDGKCMNDGCKETENLELAHGSPTQLSLDKPSGYRSSYERLNDVMKNPECYLLFCRKCHELFDGRDKPSWTLRDELI